MVEGERIRTRRGDLVFTPNGTWHGHGNPDDEPVIWADTLDWPLMDYLGCVAVRYDDKAVAGDANPEDDFSQRLYGRGGIRPMVVPVQRGGGKYVKPKFLYGGDDIRGDRKSVVSGKRGSVRDVRGGRRIIKKKKNITLK